MELVYYLEHFHLLNKLLGLLVDQLGSFPVFIKQSLLLLLSRLTDDLFITHLWHQGCFPRRGEVRCGKPGRRIVIALGCEVLQGCFVEQGLVVNFLSQLGVVNFKHEILRFDDGHQLFGLEFLLEHLLVLEDLRTYVIKLEVFVDFEFVEEKLSELVVQLFQI